MELNNLIRAAIFCAVAIGMGFSLMFIPNIELKPSKKNLEKNI